MTDTENDADAADGADAQAGSQAGPNMQVNAQYVKDLSFENPRAPMSLTVNEAQPEIQINIDVQARPIAQSNVFEVLLTLSVDAKRSGEALFIAELVYGAMITLNNIPKEQYEVACLVEAARLLFPFARQVLSQAIRDGGFPPLLLEPIDFLALYRQRKQVQGPQASGSGGDGATPPAGTATV